ncbi:Gfo/Idh/MocA family oxidoreductase [uncultured Dubosiella sp.]|uniref:Gfo/Idh/MocA family protein n=1 Tax=uncultured Dubosiella sp. TaxID=1937011 RepID=UPI0025887CFB|nr:Gfo/Idh/MocA family oxidoreductase [uncultured Dubosiella sp.]
MKWGIIGAGNIAHRFAQSIARMENTSIAMVCGRDEEKLKRFCQRFEIGRYTLDPETLLNDSAIEAVYIALPHRLHATTVLAALACKKPVLCEKPLAIDSEEVKTIIEAAKKNDTLCMEAMKERFTPAYNALKQALRARTPAYLDVTMDRLFAYDPDSYVYQTPGGGILLDCGVYGIALMQDLMKDRKLLNVACESRVAHGVDVFDRAIFTYEGATCAMECACDRTKDVQAVIGAKTWSITIPNFHRAESWTLEENGMTNPFVYPYEQDDFYGEIAHFEQLVRDGKKESDIMPLQDSLACAQIMDRIARESR